MRTIVDTRGLSCPQPVILLREALRSEDWENIEVLLDSGASLENCSRIAVKDGFTVRVEKRDEETVLIVSRE